MGGITDAVLAATEKDARVEQIGTIFKYFHLLFYNLIMFYT